MAQGGGGGDAGKYSGSLVRPELGPTNPLLGMARKNAAMKKAMSLLGGAGGPRTRRRGVLIGDAMIPSLLLGG